METEVRTIIPPPASHFPKMECVGAYSIIARILELAYVQDNIYTNKAGFKYVLTKTGFSPAINYNNALRVRELKKKLKVLEESGDTEKNARLAEKNKQYGLEIRELQEKITEMRVYKKSLSKVIQRLHNFRMSEVKVCQSLREMLDIKPNF